MRLGIFGGTFDPPHLGHRILAGEALEQLQLERVLWLLTPEPPHKLRRDFAPLAARLEMLSAAIDGYGRFELSRVDVERSGPHYALDTMRLLAEMYPYDQLVYVIGGDSLRDLPTWYKPRQLVDACHQIGVMRRPGSNIDLEVIESAIPGIHEKLQFVEAPLIEISSTQIRQRVKAGRTFKYFVPEGVYQIIAEQGLYQA